MLILRQTNKETHETPIFVCEYNLYIDEDFIFNDIFMLF